MSSVGKGRGGRESRERSRVYQARQQFHESLGRRRTRDNVIAGVGGGLLIVGLVVAQTLYFTAGPGAPAPEPTATSTSTPAPVDSSTPTPTESATPSPTSTD